MVGVTGSNPVRSTMKTVFLISAICYAAFVSGQSDYTIIYNHSDGVVSFKKQKELNDFDRQEILYTNGDSISFYSFQQQQPHKKDSTVGAKKDHHSIFTFLKLNVILHENVWTKPYNLIESELGLFNWKMHTDTMRIAGYLCHVAVDEGLVAWYTNEIPFSFGPMMYNGLPGLILMIEDHRNKILIKAASITKLAPAIVLPDIPIKSCKKCNTQSAAIKKYFSN